MTELREKLKEVLYSVLPIVLIVLSLHFSIVPLNESMLIAFLIGSVFVVIGLTLFLIGIDTGLEPIGRGVGIAILKSNKYRVVIIVSLILGFFISFAEPDLHILAKEVNNVTGGSFNNLLLVLVVSIGIGVMMTLAMIRMLKNISLKKVFITAYIVIFVLAIFSSSDFLAIAFDASGATTGAITVPFMLALASGVSALKKNSRLQHVDNFGVIGISSTGAIIGVLCISFLFGHQKLIGQIADVSVQKTGILSIYLNKFGHVAYESLMTLMPIIMTYVILQLFILKQSRKKVMSISYGILLTFLGLTLFLLGVNSGFMAVGTQLGISLASLNSPMPLLILAFLLGVTTVLAEPAVHVLTEQVEEITGGFVKRSLVLLFLSIGVGLAILLSSIRILVPNIQLWMYLLPGFSMIILLTFFIPDLFVGMAIDAGGVASGPMTATFSLAFVHGIADYVPTADLVTDGFGMIAIVAMMPILAIEILGVLYQIKMKKSKKLAIERKS